MLNHVKNYLTVYVVILIIFLISSLILTTYIHFDELDLSKDYKSLIFIFKISLFFLLGLLIGYKEYSNGILHGFMISSILVIATLGLNGFKNIDFLRTGISILVSLIGGMFGVNIPKHKKNQL